MSEKEFKFDFDKDSMVDPNRLHEECFNYARMAWKYGEALADAKEDRDLTHEKVKIQRSELILKARSDPESCGLGKAPKNDQIEAYYRTNKEYIRLKEALIKAEHKVNVLQSGNNSIQFSKSTGLDLAVQLWKGEYFSVEGLPRDIPLEWKARRLDKTEKAAEEQRSAMRRTRNVKQT